MRKTTNPQCEKQQTYNNNNNNNNNNKNKSNNNKNKSNMCRCTKEGYKAFAGFIRSAAPRVNNTTRRLCFGKYGHVFEKFPFSLSA